MTAIRRAAYVGCVGLLVLASASCNSRFFSRTNVESDPASAPDSFVVAFVTSRGRFDVMARKAWAPLGVARFYGLVQSKYYDDDRFFRVVKGFVAQFGLNGNPKIDSAWSSRRIADEPVRHSNTRGTVAYARGGPGTRSVQLYLNLVNNPKLDTLNTFGFPPIGEVIAGMAVVDSLYSGYGEATPRTGAVAGRAGPSQDSIRRSGNKYLIAGWPKLDYIKTARIVRKWKR